MKRVEGAALDTGQIEHEIENVILPTTTDNIAQKTKAKPFGVLLFKKRYMIMGWVRTYNK